MSNVSRHSNKGQTWDYRLYDQNNNLYDVFTSYPFVNTNYSQYQYELLSSAALDTANNVVSITGQNWNGWGWSSSYNTGKFKISKKLVDAVVISPVTFGDPSNYHAVLSLYESGAVSPTVPLSKLTVNHGGNHTDSQSYYG